MKVFNPCCGVTASRDGNGPQGLILLHEIVSQLEGDRIPQVEAVLGQKPLAHHAVRFSRVLRAQEAAPDRRQLVPGDPADGGHVASIHHVEGAQIVVGDLDQLPQWGEFLRFKIVL